MRPGQTKTEAGKTYVLNENHRWVLPKDNPSKAPKESRDTQWEGKPWIGSTPPDGTLQDVDARKWYLFQEARIIERVSPPPPKPVQVQAKEAFSIRNAIRTKARNLMADRAKAKALDESDPHLTIEQIVARKQAKGISGDAIWLDIIASSAKSRKSVNQKLGLKA